MPVPHRAPNWQEYRGDKTKRFKVKYNEIKKSKNFRIIPEAVVRRCSVKKVFLEVSQNSQKTPVPESLF